MLSPNEKAPRKRGQNRTMFAIYRLQVRTKYDTTILPGHLVRQLKGGETFENPVYSNNQDQNLVGFPDS